MIFLNINIFNFNNLLPHNIEMAIKILNDSIFYEVM